MMSIIRPFIAAHRKKKFIKMLIIYPNFNIYFHKWCQFNLQEISFCRYDFAIRQPLHRYDSQSRTYQPRYWHVVVMLYKVWLAESSRAPALWRHDHNLDEPKHGGLVNRWGDLPCLQKKICHQKIMLMRWKVCKFKDEDLKIFNR